MKNKLYLIKIKKCNSVVPVLINTCPAVSIAQSSVRTLTIELPFHTGVRGHGRVVYFLSFPSYCINTAFKVYINTYILP